MVMMIIIIYEQTIKLKSVFKLQVNYFPGESGTKINLLIPSRHFTVC